MAEKQLPAGEAAHDDVADAPHDNQADDGDDQYAEQDEPTQEQKTKAARQVQTLWAAPMAVTTPVVVPFCRTLKYGSRGDDVRAVQRALRKAQVRQKEPTGRYLGATVLNVKTFQKRAGLKVDGIYGQGTHQKLARYFDAWGAHLYRVFCVEWKAMQGEAGMRARIKSTAMYGHEMQARIRYTQSSLRMEGVREKIRPPDCPTWEDCSSFVTWCYWVAGAPDPNGLGYSGQGWTGTQTAHGRQVTTSASQAGDLVFYGATTITHVAVIVGANSVVSHGSDSGPDLRTLDYRGDRKQIRSYM